MSTPTAGRTVRLFLVDGTPSGIITAEIMNWTGHVLVAPRSRLPEVLARAEAVRTGVYFLIGEDQQQQSQSRVYVGESDNVGKRINQHSRDESKDFWDRLCLVTSKDQNLTKAHVRFLESRLISIANIAGRSNIENSTAPDAIVLPESDTADMEFFLQQMSMVMPVLGFDFLKPRLQQPVPKSDPIRVLTATTATPLSLILESGKHGLHAEAIYLDDEVTVLAGSRAIVEGDFHTNYTKPLREKLIARGVMKKSEDGKFLIFTENVPFSAPSAAAAVIFDRNSNGRKVWKVKETGQTLKEWQDSQLPELPRDRDM